MQRISCFLLIFILAYAVDIVEFDDNWASNPLFNVVSQGPGGVEVVFSTQRVVIEEKDIDGVAMRHFGVPGIFLPNDAGAPDLAGTGRYIAVPEGARVQVVILDVRTEVYQGIDILPAPELPLDTDDSPLRYEKDMLIYGRNAYYPDVPVKVSEVMEIRGVDVVILGITPFQYNPVTKELIVYKDIRCRVDFIGGTGHFGEDRLRSRFWEPLLQNHLLNYTSLPKIDFYSPERLQGRDGYEYIIIVPDDILFEQWADTIKNWRKLQGISCEVYTLTEVGGASTTAIKNFLQNAYSTWDPAPVAFLLLSDYPSSGDLYGITSPSFTHPYSGTYVSDNWYADFTGDNLPELDHARICAQSESQLSLMINKFLSYERNPYTASNFYDEPIVACAWQTERWFQLCGEVIRGFFINGLGKNPSRQYNIYSGTPTIGCAWSTATNTATVVNYWYNVGWLPSTTNQNNSTWWNNGTSTAITAAINSGGFLLQHRDHGGETGWGEPAYNTSHLNNLTNDMFIFVYSSNCLTGRYDWTSECFTEKFHRITNGALAVNAASQVSYSFVNDAYVWGSYDCLWPQFDPAYPSFDMTGYSDLRPCQAMTYGKYYLQASSWPYNSGDKNITYGLFHHHGDAFNILYSEIPESLTVAHDPVLPAGQTSFTVTANDSSIIALTVNYEIIGVVQGSGNPEVISIAGQSPGDTMIVTITKADYYRYVARVPVADAGMPDIPTVVKPLDYARLPDVQPTLSFHSTDPQDDNIHYRVLWDTDPNFASPESATTSLYASGVTVNFTFPSALTNGATYWWKVKCTDPGGSGYWTAYTVKRSFTIGLTIPENTCTWYQTTAAQFDFNTFNGAMVQGDSVILVPSGQVIVDTVFEQDFEAGSIPAGWTYIDGNSDGYRWTVGTSADMGTYTPPSYGSFYGYYSDDDAGSGTINNNEEFISPVISIPASAESLDIIYGYGFRVYQTGEKYRFKVRTKLGSTWSSWNTEVTYQSSASGIQTVNLTSYLTADSIQFEWFYSDSTASSHWGYGCAVDNVVLRYKYCLSNDDGTMTSAGVSIGELTSTYARQHWGNAVWHKASADDSVGVQVDYYNGSTWQLIPNTDLPGNSTGFFTTLAIDSVNLSALDTATYHTLRLNGLFYRKSTDAPDDPALLDWEIGNMATFIGIAENNENTVITPILRVFPSVTTSHLNILCALGAVLKNGRLKIYDVTGRAVKQFDLSRIEIDQPTSLVWDRCDDMGRRVAAGVYFIRLEADDYTKTEKAILLR